MPKDACNKQTFKNFNSNRDINQALLHCVNANCHTDGVRKYGSININIDAAFLRKPAVDQERTKPVIFLVMVSVFSFFECFIDTDG